jgi:DNA-binding XRE family transcriptional regulator
LKQAFCCGVCNGRNSQQYDDCQGTQIVNRTKRARLEARGWRIGSAANFLELTPEEAAFVETKLALTQTLRERRTAQHLTQHSLAKRLSSSQSRIAKVEAGDSSVSVDLLLRALFALGAKPRDIANALQRRKRVAA